MAEMVYDYPRRDEDEDACIVVNSKSGKTSDGFKENDGAPSASAPAKKVRGPKQTSRSLSCISNWSAEKSPQTNRLPPSKSDKSATKDASTAGNKNDSISAKAKKSTSNKKDPNAPKRPRGRPPKNKASAPSNTKDTAIVLSDDEDAELGPSAKRKATTSSTKSKQGTLPPVSTLTAELHPLHTQAGSGAGLAAPHGYDMASPMGPHHPHYNVPQGHVHADPNDVIYALQQDLTAERSLRMQLEAECAHLRAALADHEAQFVTRLAKETQAMQQRLQEAIMERDELEAAYGGVSVRVQALGAEVVMLENKLKEVEEENERLKAQMRNEVDENELHEAQRMCKTEVTPIPALQRAGNEATNMAGTVNAAEMSAAVDLMQLDDDDNNGNSGGIGPAGPVHDRAAILKHITQHHDCHPSTEHRDRPISLGKPRITAPTTCPETPRPPEGCPTSLGGTIQQQPNSYQTNIPSPADRAVGRAYRARFPYESVGVRSYSQTNMNDRNLSLSPRASTLPPINPHDGALSGQLQYNNPTVAGPGPVPNWDDDVFLPGQNETQASLHRAFVDKYGSLSREQLAEALRNAELAAAQVCDELLETREKWHVARDRLAEVEEELGKVRGELERMRGVVERVMRERDGNQDSDHPGARETYTYAERTEAGPERTNTATEMATAGQDNTSDELPTDVSTLHSMLANLRSERDNMHAELAHLQTRLHDLQILHEKTKAELAERKKEYDEVEAEVRAGQSHWAQEIRLMNLKLDMLRSEASTNSSTITSLQIQICDLQKEKTKLKDDKKKLEEGLEKVKKEFEDEGRRLVKEMNASWEEEVQWLEGELDRAREEAERLAGVCKRQGEEIRELREKLEEMVKREGLLHQELEVLRAKNTEATDKKAKDEKGK